jgi:hypothetical protein
MAIEFFNEGMGFECEHFSNNENLSGYQLKSVAPKKIRLETEN